MVVERTGCKISSFTSLLPAPIAPVAPVANASMLVVLRVQSHHAAILANAHHAKVVVHASAQKLTRPARVRLDPPESATDVKLRQAGLHCARVEDPQAIVVASGGQQVTFERQQRRHSGAVALVLEPGRGAFQTANVECAEQRVVATC